MLFDDAVTLEWSPEQQAYFASQPQLHYLLQAFKGGVHFRPLGDEDALVGIWTYNRDTETRTQHIPDAPTIDPYYGEIVLRGLAHYVPELKRYAGKHHNPTSTNNPHITLVKAGYYCKTPENRPFIGPAWEDDKRVMLLGALSGFGIMTAPAAAELIATHTINLINKQAGGGGGGDEEDTMPLPPYYKEFLPSRYEDEAYLQKVAQLDGNTGQL